MIFQQYSRKTAASSGMPSARKALSCLRLRRSELRTLTRPVTFLAMTEGRPSVVKCFLQLRSLFYIVYKERMKKHKVIIQIYIKMPEYTLIRTKIINGSPNFEVSKDGLKFLRQFRHQKVPPFRLIVVADNL